MLAQLLSETRAHIGLLQALKDARQLLALLRQGTVALSDFRFARLLKQAMPLGVLALPVCALRLDPVTPRPATRYVGRPACLRPSGFARPGQCGAVLNRNSITLTPPRLSGLEHRLWPCCIHRGN